MTSVVCGITQFGRNRYSFCSVLALLDRRQIHGAHKECKMNWLKGLPTSHALGWIVIGLLAIVIVLVFVRRLVGIDG